MTISATTLRKLAALSLSSEQMTGVLDILAGHEEAEEARKSAQRERTRRARDKQRNVTVALQTHDGNSDDTRGGVARVEDKLLTTEIEPQTKKETREDALRSEFEQFWAIWPNKVGKPKALAAFVTARKRTELSAILDGVRRYVATKPTDRPWLNPATFLNQERWADQPAVVVPMARGSPRPNPLMDRLDELTRPPNDDNSPTSQALVLHASAGFGGR